jgi:poly-beta-1,6-N-acetyl-D-glucosamine synthase
MILLFHCALLRKDLRLNMHQVPLQKKQETSSASIEEEMKRKVRIAAGSLQTLPRLRGLLNPFKHGFFTFQYLSHKVFRWTLVPLSILCLLPMNLYLIFNNLNPIYKLFFLLQVVFYLFALLGLIFNEKKIKLSFFFAPYYLLIMNYALLLGFVKYFKGKQSVNWEKAKRA